jgi:hypothetical protein
MKTTNALSTFAALSLLAFAAPVLAQSAPDATTDLRKIASVFGDANGHLTSVDANRNIQMFAYRLGRSFVPYTAGDVVSTSDTFAYCIEDARGQLSSCDVIDGSDPTAYSCDEDYACSCNRPMDCIDMFFSLVCVTPLDCGVYGCKCDSFVGVDP